MNHELSITFGGTRRERQRNARRDLGDGRVAVAADPQPMGGSVGRLRGADVQVNARMVGRVAMAAVLLTLLLVAVLLTVAGVKKNQQIQELRAHAVPVNATVTSCVGLLGGSGTNFVGYSCTGTYTVGGSRHTELLPGTTPHARGDIVKVVAVPNDPALVSTPALVASQHASWGVFVLPAVLFAIAVVGAGLLLARMRLRRGADGRV